MTARAARRDDLAGLIFDMDVGVGNLVKWALVVRDFGSTDDGACADALYVVGEAMLDQARAVQEDWQRAFDLSRPLSGGRA
ncbi:hypothetical protein [Methylobacterium haplocladii]|uniref:Uncharacterized protein n=1 Tax=Methylobacterium haplocladii TaxID=1176176 RepID=A0A512IVY9_9HYPH|nr:hypothetical protein [Methylobacterium haplocladii]GEP01894.1 hypothetical protein MHA02_42810 [Methylobacterium haplocladii]GJD85764.1 hypothetical protein HPGCJGGD_3656 [Methylobacterium haplocladii]GLS59848.1 hypothetical protein GCM10007887_25210 [Methylobacterium haplocladii]